MLVLSHNNLKVIEECCSYRNALKHSLSLASGGALSIALIQALDRGVFSYDRPCDAMCHHVNCLERFDPRIFWVSS